MKDAGRTLAVGAGSPGSLDAFDNDDVDRLTLLYQRETKAPKGDGE